MRLLISGGGTGGHVYPALTVAGAVQRQAAEKREPVDLLYVGRADGVESRLAVRALIAYQAIQVGGVRGLAPWTALYNLWRAFRAIGRVRAVIRSFKPTVLFATGGYASAPVVWASTAERVPTVIYLPDLEPGWAIRVSAHWATRVAVSFPEAQKHFAPGKTTVTGYPVRAEFFNTNKTIARQRFQLDPQIPTVTILGGSSGAHAINQAVVTHLAELAQLTQVLAIAGRNDEEWVRTESGRLPDDLRERVRVFGYLDEDLPHALAAAEVVIARAGAATLGEFPALDLPAVLVPYPHAGKHQERNAQFLSERGAAIQIENAELGDVLVSTLKGLFDAPEQLTKMRAAMHALAQPHAAETIASLLYSLEDRE
jgi:UDP-N-acetylglucosamine--N-acetylmuramyl-(pentapeptide) pyrophosphoryl-undecaprenol N-acetylglucosamine transferase